MANVSVFDITGGDSAALTTDGIAAAAALQTVPCRRDGKMVLRVSNINAAVDVVVRLLTGDGPRAMLGPKDIAVSAGKTAYIALYDTARHKRLSDNTVSVGLLAAGGGALSSEALAGVTIEALRL